VSLDAIDPPLLAGRVLDDKYRLTRLIGQGGMGAVHEAEHLGTGRTVAVKTILPALVRDPGAVERFRREAKAAGRLRHPNIVDVTDFGIAHDDGFDVAYLAMEYLTGTTLHELIRSRGTLQAEVVVAIVEQVALALAAAHDVGVVHRDLKPDNIWLVPDPRGGFSVRVLDFGIAKLRDFPSAVSDGDAIVPAGDWEIEQTLIKPETPTLKMATPTTAGRTPSTTQPLTQVGTAIGTPSYMSPEQCRGSAVDFRSDIYSLGVIAYEALSGRRPFEEKNMHALIDAHQNREPPPLESIANVSTRVAAVVRKAMAKSPDARFDSATAMAGSLYAAVEGPMAILARALTLYIDHFSAFLRVSLDASLPALLLALAGAVIAAFSAPQFIVVMVSAVIAWASVTIMTNWHFAVVVDLLRKRPLDTISPREVAADLRRRLGLDAAASRLRVLVGYAKFAAGALRANLKDAMASEHLMPFIALLESCPVPEVGARAAALARSMEKSYLRIRMAMAATVLIFPALEACVLYALAVLFRVSEPAPLVVFGAFLLLPVNAVFLNPIFSSAFALLYFRARQANGEDVGLASATLTRL
jgi:serine/threonine-protein kinase